MCNPVLYEKMKINFKMTTFIQSRNVWGLIYFWNLLRMVFCCMIRRIDSALEAGNADRCQRNQIREIASSENSKNVRFFQRRVSFRSWRLRHYFIPTICILGKRTKRREKSSISSAQWLDSRSRWLTDVDWPKCSNPRGWSTVGHFHAPCVLLKARQLRWSDIIKT